MLAEAGMDPNVVVLVGARGGRGRRQRSSAHCAPRCASSTSREAPPTGRWLSSRSMRGRRRFYTEKAGVNQIIIDDAVHMKAVARNIAFSLSLYTGQMCTAPQNRYVPRDGIDTDEGHLSFDQVAEAIAEGVRKLLADPARAVEVLGAVQNDGVLRRLEAARSLMPCSTRRPLRIRRSPTPRCARRSSSSSARTGRHVSERVVRSHRVRDRDRRYEGKPRPSPAMLCAATARSRWRCTRPART